MLQVAAHTGAVVEVVDDGEEGRVDVRDIERRIHDDRGDPVGLVAITHPAVASGHRREVAMSGSDDSILDRISALVEEEHHLYGKSTGGGPLSEDDEARLRELEVRLDQCWDLLRQRRARRSAGLDPDEAGARPAAVVERYRQ